METKNNLKFYGKVIHVCETISGVSAKTGKSWSKQEFVMEELDAQYPQRIVFSIFGEEKIKTLNVIEDQILEVSYSVSANQSGARWYGSNDAWKTVADPNKPQPIGTVITQQVTIGAQQTAAPTPSDTFANFPPQTPQGSYDAFGSPINPETGIPF